MPLAIDIIAAADYLTTKWPLIGANRQDSSSQSIVIVVMIFT